MRKTLVINGKKWAFYEIENNILFLYVIPEAYRKDPYESIFFDVIQTIENVPLKGMSYLNIHAKN